MTNEHLVYAYGELKDRPGCYLLIIGLTKAGLQFLENARDDSGNRKTLIMAPPSGKPRPVAQVVVFHEADKAALKARLREVGVPVHEVN